MTPTRWVPAVRAVRSLGVLLMVIALVGCAGAATTAPSPTPVPSPTPAASISAPSAEPTATPMPTLRTGYDLRGVPLPGVEDRPDRVGGERRGPL
jgi:hypothetical protein